MEPLVYAVPVLPFSWHLPHSNTHSTSCSFLFCSETALTFFHSIFFKARPVVICSLFHFFFGFAVIGRPPVFHDRVSYLHFLSRFTSEDYVCETTVSAPCWNCFWFGCVAKQIISFLGKLEIIIRCFPSVFFTLAFATNEKPSRTAHHHNILSFFFF